MTISSISSNAIYTSQSVLKTNTTRYQAENMQNLVNSTASGDTVTLSDEAQNRLQSLQATSSTDTADTTGTAQPDTAGSSSSDGGVASAAAQSDSADSASSGATSDTSTINGDEIAKLEKEIQALQIEITALAAKALSDDTARSEMTTKQAEMARLAATLTQIQTQQA